MKILAVPGSLRQKSMNRTLLEAAIKLAPEGMTITLYDGIGLLPHFNPDLEMELPSEVMGLKKRIRESDGLLISSPEYAHGVPGSLKNALDWLVGGSEVVGKPVALLDASTRSHYAQDSLVEILKTMSARVVVEAFARVPLLGRELSVGEVVGDPPKQKELRRALEAFQRALKQKERA